MTPLGQDPGAPDTGRLILTIVLCTVVYLTWAAFFAPVPPPLDPDTPALVAEPSPTAAGPTSAETGAISADEADGAEKIAAPMESPQDALPVVSHTIRVPGAPAAQDDQNQAVRGGMIATFSSAGGQLTGFVLDGYDDVNQSGDEVVPKIDLAQGDGAGPELFALKSRSGSVVLDPMANYALKEVNDREVRFFRRTLEGLEIERIYTFKEGHFGFQHEVKVRNTSGQALDVALDLTLTGQETSGTESSLFAGFAPSTAMISGVCMMGDENETVPSMELVEESFQQKGPVSHVGLGWHYFLAALIPLNQMETEGCSLQAKLSPSAANTDQAESAGHVVTVTLQNSSLQLAPGGEKSWSYTSFMGPKQLALLQSQGHSLESNIDFGMFGVLSRPILWLLVTFYGMSGNFGLAIIFLTFFIKLLTFPLTQKSYTSMQQMKVLAPMMKELQQKYGHDRTLLGQKQMEMYKEKGINPMAGCFPMLVQMPIWFALYRTIWNSVELYQQPFYGWITDLSQPDVFPLFGFALLPFFVGVLMLGQTLMQPPPQDQPQMKYVMWGMPIMFTFFMFGMPAGLSLYMITNSVLTVIQQLVIKRKFDEQQEPATQKG